jgi:hypothetical protein
MQQTETINKRESLLHEKERDVKQFTGITHVIVADYEHNEWVI